MTDLPLMTDKIQPPANYAATRNPGHGHICSAEPPFASLQIGSRTYDIAHALRDDAMLAFRVAGQQEFSALDRQLTDGWVKIGADILLLDPDVLFDFLLTHAVTKRSATGDLTQMEFDTLGVHWSARLLHDRDGEVRLGGGDWQYARLGLNAPKEGRKRAILLLLATLPNARSQFEPHITQWAERIAQGVTIKPVI
jgi:hypothetical protein